MSTSTFSAAHFIPEQASLPELREAAARCQGCPLYQNATQTVFGAGPPSARLVLVGEQPGDQEDRRGQPFVGPAGRLLDRALAEAGIKLDDVYVTNAVKHFKFTRQDEGKRRIHQKPTTAEMAACRPWLTAELGLIEPEVIVALGATAAESLLGPSFRVTEQRGVPLPCPPLDLLGSSAATATSTAAARATEEMREARDARESHEAHETHAASGAPATSGETGGGSKAAQARDGREHHRPGGRGRIVATIHPSAVLRATDRDAAYAGLVADLAVAARMLD